MSILVLLLVLVLLLMVCCCCWQYVVVVQVLVRNILDEALEHEAVSQKAQLMDSIKAAQLQLKPVSVISSGQWKKIMIFLLTFTIYLSLLNS